MDKFLCDFVWPKLQANQTLTEGTISETAVRMLQHNKKDLALLPSLKQILINTQRQALRKTQDNPDILKLPLQEALPLINKKAARRRLEKGGDTIPLREEDVIMLDGERGTAKENGG